MARRIADADSYAGQAFPPRLLAEHIAPDVEVFADRHAMAGVLMGGVIAEVGTYLGGFAAYLLEACEPSELHLFDRDVQRIRPAVRNHPVVEIHLGDSSTELAYFQDDYFDAIYIDGDHSLAGVARDVVIARTKVRKGGLLVFNDYTLWSVIEGAPYGICHAVADLCYDGFRIVGYAFQHQGYPDVALQRPG